MSGLKLEKRIERLENILIDLAFYKGKCAYIYLSDLQKALKKYGLIKEIPNEKIYKIVYTMKKEGGVNNGRNAFNKQKQRMH